MIAGGFHTLGAMDRANYELAWHLADKMKAKVDLVSHAVQAPLVNHQNVTWHHVPRPLKSYAIGDCLLGWKGGRIAKQLNRHKPQVIVNGGNCSWPGTNWVHALHASWERRDSHAPVLFRLRAMWVKSLARWSELRSLTLARLVLTNSNRTRSQVLRHCIQPPRHVHTVYLGTDASTHHQASRVTRAHARQLFGFPENKPLVAFIGSLGYDRNKGFDIAFAAWESLCKDPNWDVDLVVAGAGQEVDLWKKHSAAAGLKKRIHFLGFTQYVTQLLAAVDALVSPTHYESYGLNVHEALCFGHPAFVTRTAGVAERYPADLDDFLLSHPPNSAELVQRLREWRKDIMGFRERVSPISALFRQRTWSDMAAEILKLIEATS
jgi:glycosyltransferase involved in cell wall biosynthesis